MRNWLTPNRKAVLANRLRSFLWRASGMLAVFALEAAQQLLTDLELPLIAVTVGGLIVGELTKYLNVDRKNL